MTDSEMGFAWLLALYCPFRGYDGVRLAMAIPKHVLSGLNCGWTFSALAACFCFRTCLRSHQGFGGRFREACSVHLSVFGQTLCTWRLRCEPWDSNNDLMR